MRLQATCAVDKNGGQGYGTPPKFLAHRLKVRTALFACARDTPGRVGGYPVA
jgi:hypothetical protein